jgi:hypothetical protein
MEISFITTALDKTIEDLGFDFYSRGAFSYATEADVQATLLGRLRANVLFNVRTNENKIELVHAEFPAFGAPWKGAARYDLAIWHPDFAQEAYTKWGIHIRHWPEELQKQLVLTAVEMERIHGLPWGLRQYQIFSDNAQSIVDQVVRNHSDIRKLLQSWCKIGYFLIFWDQEIQKKEDIRIFFQLLNNAFVKLVQENQKLHIFCICRDGNKIILP